MPPEGADRDLALLVDMFNAARECQDFEQDRMRVRAVERMLETIAEATRGLSDELRQQFPENAVAAELDVIIDQPGNNH